MAMGFATTMPPSLLFLYRVSAEIIERGVWATIAGRGVLRGLLGRFAIGGGVMASRDVTDIPKSKEGMSCGGDDKGFETAIVRLVFFGRSN